MGKHAYGGVVRQVIVLETEDLHVQASSRAEAKIALLALAKRKREARNLWDILDDETTFKVTDVDSYKE